MFQELVNLFLTGRAASNVFNDVMELDTSGGIPVTLKGIHCRSDCGLLSLFEHYKSCQVSQKYDIRNRCKAGVTELHCHT